MNKIFIITFAALSMILLSISVYAQQAKPHFNKEAFLAKRNAFITAEVGLTPEEAAVFIPLCNEYQEKRFELGKQCRKQIRELRYKKTPSATEYTEAVDCYLDTEIKEAQLQKEYFGKFKKILSPEKLFKYQEAENKFAKEFMKGREKKK